MWPWLSTYQCTQGNIQVSGKWASNDPTAEEEESRGRMHDHSEHGGPRRPE